MAAATNSNAKTGLTVSVKFTPQAQADNLFLSEDNVGTGATGPAPDIDQMMLSNDGAANAATIVGITLDGVSAVQNNLTNYITSLANNAPI